MSDPTSSPTAVLHALEAIPSAMARALGELLPRVERAGYLRFLDTMFHYTRHSGARLVDAATSARDPELAAFYRELAREEAPHYQLARRDLARFDGAPSPEPPPPVRAFEAFWAAPGDEPEVVRLGALFALEGVAAHLGDDVRPALARLGLGPSDARFVLVHLQADQEHGARCRDHALRLASRAPQALLDGARTAAPLWLAMHHCLVDDPAGDA